MIVKKNKQWQVYARGPTCSVPCDHKECADGKLSRKVYVGTFDTWREADGAHDHFLRESKKLRDAREVLDVRLRVLASERDKLRDLAETIGELTLVCDEATEALEQAAAALSRHV